MRVWVDLTNTAHVVVLRPLVELLERAGHEVAITARPLSHTVELLEEWGHPHTVLGWHGGARRLGKARAAAGRVAEMVRFGVHRGFDCALAHGSTDLPAACRALRIPSTTMFDYEWAALQHHVGCRLASRVLVPQAIPKERLAQYGARPPKLVRYPGLKEEYYLSDFEPDPGVMAELGLKGDEVLCVVRMPPHYALYLRDAEGKLLTSLLRRLSQTSDTQTVVLPRTRAQAEGLRSLAGGWLVVPHRAVDGRSLIAFADVLISAGGTMNREAAVLGTPVWSVFEGRLGAVDELLAREGRLRFLRDPDELRPVKKTEGRWSARIRRDPAELLRLALPWLTEPRPSSPAPPRRPGGPH